MPIGDIISLLLVRAGNGTKLVNSKIALEAKSTHSRPPAALIPSQGPRLPKISLGKISRRVSQEDFRHLSTLKVSQGNQILLRQQRIPETNHSRHTRRASHSAPDQAPLYRSSTGLAGKRSLCQSRREEAPCFRCWRRRVDCDRVLSTNACTLWQFKVGQWSRSDCTYSGVRGTPVI